MVSALHMFLTHFLKGRDGPALLSAMHAIWDCDWHNARQYLLTSEVLLNASAPDGGVGLAGGTNVLSHKLQDQIRLFERNK